MACPINKLDCPCVDYGKEGRCDYPYKREMNYMECSKTTHNLSKNNKRKGEVIKKPNFRQLKIVMREYFGEGYIIEQQESFFYIIKSNVFVTIEYLDSAASIIDVKDKPWLLIDKFTNSYERFKIFDEVIKVAKSRIDEQCKLYM